MSETLVVLKYNKKKFTNCDADSSSWHPSTHLTVTTMSSSLVTEKVRDSMDDTSLLPSIFSFDITLCKNRKLSRFSKEYRTSGSFMVFLFVSIWLEPQNSWLSDDKKCNKKRQVTSQYIFGHINKTVNLVTNNFAYFTCRVIRHKVYINVSKTWGILLFSSLTDEALFF